MNPVEIGQWFKWKDSSRIGEVVAIEDHNLTLQYKGKKWIVSFYTLKLDWEKIPKPRK